MQWPEVNTGDYVAYHKEYIDRIPMQCNVPAVLEENMHKAEQFFNSIPEAKLELTGMPKTNGRYGRCWDISSIPSALWPTGLYVSQGERPNRFPGSMIRHTQQPPMQTTDRPGI